MLDSLFDYRFPYMMCMHNAPVNSGDYSKDFHFHIEFFPPMRQRRQAEVQRFQRNRRMGALQPDLPGGDLQGTARRLRKVHGEQEGRIRGSRAGKPGGNGPLRTHR